MRQLTYFNSKTVCLIGLACSIAISCSVVAGEETGSERTGEHQATDNKSTLSALFELEPYAQRFNKRYGSRIEAAARHLYLMASAFKVCVASIAYRLRERSSYLALNKFSDLSRQELDRMRNKRRARDLHEDLGAGLPIEESEAIELDADEPLGQLKLELQKSNLEEMVEEGLAALEISAINKRSGRVKREASNRRPQPLGQPPRELPVERLIQSGRQEPESAAVLAKLDTKPMTHNGKFDPLENVPMSRGRINKQIKRVKVHSIAGDEPKLLSKLVSFSRELKGKLLRLVKARSDSIKLQSSATGDENNLEKLPDEMFVDLRQSNCMFKPRNQGQCGSCYIFAGLAMIEYLFCKETGRLLAFSEQYLLDCGPGHFKSMSGCDGGLDEAVPEFVHNFGVLLGSAYPYIARESQCPITSKTDISTTGYIRMNIKHITWVPMSTWPRVLQSSPIYVGVSVRDEFYLYGGGVDQVNEFKYNSNDVHAMIVIGHGREDGREFWLVRNSYGTSWGESGYYKLEKQFARKCVENRGGYVYATSDTINYETTPRRNDAYDGSAKLVQPVDQKA